MTSVILPPEVELRMDLEAQLEKMSRQQERHSYLRWFNQQLQFLDPYLELVKAAENSTEPALIPGFWHVKRNNPNDLPTFYPIHTQDGGFMEPHMGVLDDLRRWDTSRPGWLEEKRKAQTREFTKREEERQELMVTEMAERIRHYETPSVSMKSGWVNSVKGKRGNKK